MSPASPRRCARLLPLWTTPAIWLPAARRSFNIATRSAQRAKCWSHAREIRRVLGDTVTLIMNDRADICIAAEYQGVHVGQDDLSPEGARTVIGANRILGVSTHNLEQLQEADAGPADYIAFGPVFANLV